MSQSFLARLLSFGILLLLAALIWVLDRAAELPDDAKGSDLSKSDFVAERIAASRFGPNGVQVMSLSASGVRHIPLNDTTQFIETRLVLDQPGEPRVQVLARQAHTLQRGAEVWLSGDVELRRAGDVRYEPLRVTTREIYVDTQKRIARSSAPVEIQLGKSRASAVGFVADAAKQSVELKSKVRMTYVPKNRTRDLAELR